MQIYYITHTLMRRFLEVKTDETDKLLNAGEVG